MGVDYSIRAGTVDDAEQISEIYGHYVASSPASFEVEPPDAPEIRRRISASIDTYPWDVAGARERLLGYGYAGPLRPRAAYRFSVELSVYVRPDCLGLGIGRALMRSLLDGVTDRGFANAFAGVTLPNPASVGLFESFGFEPVGVFRNVGYKFGAWHDVGWWQLPLHR
jgi:L-amino acid N-acyltransferase YncA